MEGATSSLMSGRREKLLMFCVEGFPNGVGGFTNAVSLDQFPRHRREHVIVSIDALQSFAGRLAFHGERHQLLLSYERQSSRLHGPLVAEELHPRQPPLCDTPGSPARLPQSVQRVAGLIDDGWEIPKSSPASTSLGWPMTTRTPSLTCFAAKLWDLRIR